MQPNLTILCVSKGERHAWPFLSAMSALAERCRAEFVIAADGQDAEDLAKQLPCKIVPVQSHGYLESVHDYAVAECSGRYILRLDDDEKASPAMVDWLAEERYFAADHWKFARASLWQTAGWVILSPQLFPDHQTRLSVKAMAGGRTSIHCGSPFGGGSEAPVLIEHHKFLVKSRAERAAVAARYDSIHPGTGTGGMLAFNLPEAVYPELVLAPIRDGRLAPWSDAERRTVKP
jgi:hypothetical protein